MRDDPCDHGDHGQCEQEQQQAELQKRDSALLHGVPEVVRIVDLVPDAHRECSQDNPRQTDQDGEHNESESHSALSLRAATRQVYDSSGIMEV